MKINIIVALCKNLGIGYQQAIPWLIREDLNHFYELTVGSVVIMGRETYFSIPEKHRPLKDRYNMVLTREPAKYQHLESGGLGSTNLVFIDRACLFPPNKKIFVIGGASIYQQFMTGYEIERIYVTYIDRAYPCDRFFPMSDQFQLVEYSDNYFSDHEQCHYRYLDYVPITQPHGEYQYLNLLKDIISHGCSREDRTQTGTISLFAKQLRFDISQTIPLITTKFVPFKMIIKELLWFLKGQTDNRILQAQDVHIWDGNTTRDFLDQRGLTNYQVGDIGPMYGFQLRHFGTPYQGCQHDYQGQGIDQLENVIHLLKTDPFSRRIAMTTYNVSDLEQGVLHPCHGIYIQFYADQHDDRQTYLSCHMLQRSVDCGCGLPFNIASYAILTHIIAQKVGMIPHELIISTGDTHIYRNHIDMLTQQITRIPYPFPILKLGDLANKSWDAITLDDFELIGYLSHPSIKLVMNV